MTCLLDFKYEDLRYFSCMIISTCMVISKLLPQVILRFLNSYVLYPHIPH